MARIIIERLTKIFPEKRGQSVTALNDLSLSIEENELLVLAGPSGCGKTTTLRLIAGLEEPSSGTISIDGKCIDDVPAGERDVAMVFQNHALYPHMTARENMAFGLKIRKHSESEIARRIDEISALLRIGDCLDRKPAGMSGGQRQRLALGRALVLQPRVLLLDEPLSSLDGPLRAQMRLEISHLHRQLACTILYVTHDQLEGMALGQRMAILKEGVLQQVADPEKIYHRPANLFVAGFVGLPPMNFFTGKIESDGAELFFWEKTSSEGETSKGFRIRLLDKTLAARVGAIVMMGVRPEHIRVDSERRDNDEVEAILEQVENLGSESYLHFKTAGHRCVARSTSYSERLTPGNAKLKFELRFAQFFDPANGQALA